MADQFNVLVICGSLRKGSYNAALTRALPGLAPPEMKLVTAPAIGTLPLYNADIQEASGFPGPAEDLAAAIRAADGVLFVTPGIQLVDAGRAEERDRLGLADERAAVQGKAGRHPVLLAGSARRCAHAVSLAHVDDIPQRLHLRHAGGVRRQCGDKVRQGHARAERSGRPGTPSRRSSPLSRNSSSA